MAARDAATVAGMIAMKHISKTRNATLILCLGASALMLGACATIPPGPSVMVLPGTGKSFEQFRGDESYCRQYADSQVGTTSNAAAENSGIKSAAVGTAIGAVAGAAIGGSQGAGVGAGTGLIVGALAGSGAANASSYGVQRRYDFAFEQCMYAKGHKIPSSGAFASSGAVRRPAAPPPPPPPRNAPPPPYEP